MNTSNVARNVMYTCAVLAAGFVAGAYSKKSTVVTVVKTVTTVTVPAHVVNGMTLTDQQYADQVAIQKAANDKMDADYSATLYREEAANNAKMDQLVIALAKKAKTDHGLWIAAPIKHNTSL